jgi:hypothetical protein
MNPLKLSIAAAVGGSIALSLCNYIRRRREQPPVAPSGAASIHMDALDWLVSIENQKSKFKTQTRKFDNRDDWLRFLEDVRLGRARPCGMARPFPFMNKKRNAIDRGLEGTLEAEFWFDYGPDISIRPIDSAGQQLTKHRFVILHLHFEGMYDAYMAIYNNRGLIGFNNPAMRDSLITGMNVRHSTTEPPADGRQYKTEEALQWREDVPVFKEARCGTLRAQLRHLRQR